MPAARPKKKPPARAKAATKPVARAAAKTAAKAAPKKAPARRAAGGKLPGPLVTPEEALTAFALTLPDAVEEFPWGDRAIKVNKKVFVFLGTHEGGLAMSTKLPRSAAIALTLPFASPTRYGLGRSGWVTAQFTARETPPLDMLRAWIEESYRAVAPQKLLATLDG